MSSSWNLNVTNSALSFPLFAYINTVMSEVLSTFQLQPGDRAPDFTLPDGLGASHSLTDLTAGKSATVIAFACNHCPFVVHLADAVAKFATDYDERGVQVIAINSNDVANYPADAPEKMVTFADQYGWSFPYLYDESQEVAHAYGAACTPDFYVFDQDLALVYAGQLDSTRPGRNEDITGEDLRRAVDHVLESGSPVDGPWQPSSGCNIKWKEGNAPAYF